VNNTRTKIVATVGPASDSDEMIVRLAKAGVDVFRVNMSHGTRTAQVKLIRRLRSVPQKNGLFPVGILADLSGPKVRTGTFPGGGIKLTEGQRLKLVAGSGEGSDGVIHIDYDALGEGMKRGHKILLDDGMLELRTVSAKKGEIDCTVVKGGELKDRKGVNFPGLPLRLPSLTDKDRADLQAVLGAGVDYIALSFVRRAKDVTELKSLIEKAGRRVPVISKIERPEAVREIRKVIAVSDGVMVARGDLGVEMDPAVVPTIQREVIRYANAMGRPVITATQMLDSMIRSPRPTRAEASDVAGAVYDGTDAVMLSGETAFGEYPTASVRMMDRIAREAERHANVAHPRKPDPSSTPDILAHSACLAADSLGAKAIICFTRSGATALMISGFRPKTPVIAATPDEAVLRRLRLYYGILPVRVRLKRNTDSMVREVEKSVAQRRLVRKGDRVVVTLGVPVLVESKTNLMVIHTVGETFRH